ncbi:MAG: hypothetical protein DIU76_12025 [Bacillota bacterium]|jgi:uncharacterized protein (DUF983 family)|nr:MAG: hypothetical protein DIU76_12025 [Bacillota bacterium]
MGIIIEGQQRPGGRALLNGFRGRCPACGNGRMFRAFLKVNDSCPSCGEELHHHQADDAPAYFDIAIVGHVVVPMALAVETAFAPAYWIHLALWLPVTLGLSLGLLQPIKGAIVGWQWANRMHGFEAAPAKVISDPRP